MGPVSQRPSLRLRLTLTSPMVMAPILTPMEATEPMAMDTLMLIMACTTERGLLMLSPRPLPRLTLPSSMAPMVMAPILTPMEATEPMAMDTLMLTMVPTTARGPLMLSPPLLLSPLPMLMPTTATTAMVSGPTTATVWDTED